MTYQRRRGIDAKIWRVEEQTDDRNNVHKVAVPVNDYTVKVWIYPQRSGKAEVPGQQHINVIRIGIPYGVQGIELWSRVEMLGKQWDVVTPPSFHNGSHRSTRHYSIDVRERP